MRILVVLLTLLPTALLGQSIQEIQGEADASPYLDLVVTTTGVVTASTPEGFQIQNGSGPWSGIYVFDAAQPDLGDQVSVTGTVLEFYELTELGSITDVTISSSGNDLPEPELLTSGEVADEQWEGVLVRVEEALCTNNDLGFGEFELDDSSGPCRVDDAFIGSTPAVLTGISYSVTGVQTYSFGNFKILPRTEAEIVLASPLFFTELPEEFDLATTSLAINWQTNIEADTELDYGLTPAYELGSFTDDATVTEHSVPLVDLTPATPLYIRARSTSDEGDVITHERVVITTSESSGTIEVLFTQEPDQSVATISAAKWTANIADSIASYIGMAQNTLDITMYDLMDCNEVILQAINARAEAGVVVRYITDEEPENIALDLLDPEIPVLAGNTEGIMHDKFILIDRDDALNAWVITGSTNHTGANLGWDYNNQVRIQDQSLCRAYTLEFEEMWGSTGANFDAGNAAFASQKTDNTPHKFVIGGSDAEMYFSPSDGTAAQIAEHLLMAEDRMAFAVMAFTENSLGNTVVAVNDAIGNVQGVIDYVEFSGSEFDYLVDQGVDVVDYQNEDGTQWPDGPVMHSKYAVVDYGQDDTNPITITGSHNWTASAGSINDENTLILFNAEVANWFYQDFMGIRNYLGAVRIDGLAPTSGGVDAFPNPTDGAFQLHSPVSGAVTISDLTGRVVLESHITAGTDLMLELPTGTYAITVNSGRGQALFSRLLVR